MPEQNSIVSKDDLFIERGGDGELLPVRVSPMGMEEEIEVRPVTYGKIKEFFSPDTDVADIDESVIAELLREHVVDPDLSDITEDDVANRMNPMVPQALLMGVLEASGLSQNMSFNDEGDLELEEGN